MRCFPKTFILISRNCWMLLTFPPTFMTNSRPSWVGFSAQCPGPNSYPLIQPVSLSFVTVGTHMLSLPPEPALKTLQPIFISLLLTLPHSPIPLLLNASSPNTLPSALTTISTPLMDRPTNKSLGYENSNPLDRTPLFASNLFPPPHLLPRLLPLPLLPLPSHLSSRDPNLHTHSALPNCLLPKRPHLHLAQPRTLPFKYPLKPPTP